MKKIYVASRNPVKVACTRAGFERCFPYVMFDVEGVNIPSGVPAQPMTDKETYDGALIRAERAKQAFPDGEFWVGIEGGLDQKDGAMEAFAWVVIIGRFKSGKSRTSTFYLPPAIIELVLKGHELGEATDIIFNKDGTKMKSGAVGMLTRELLNRTEYYEQAITLALIPFINPHLF